VKLYRTVSVARTLSLTLAPTLAMTPTLTLGLAEELAAFELLIWLILCGA
jgi:hypothetical protein